MKKKERKKQLKAVLNSRAEERRTRKQRKRGRLRSIGGKTSQLNQAD